MPISLQHRRIGGITVLTCSGRLVEGPESVEMRQTIDRVLEFGTHVILNLAGIDFVDSSGLGLLVRYTMRVRNANGVLKLCGVTPRLATIITMTRLEGVFEMHATEEDAVAAFFDRQFSTVPHAKSSDILCVIKSDDVQALVREMLARAGYGVLSSGNVPDGLMLLRAARPKFVVIDRALRHGPQTDSVVKFNRLTADTAVVELEDGFAQRDPADASRALLDQIRELGAAS